MGCYINPKIGTKEEWINTHGELISNVEFFVSYDFKNKRHLPVVLIDNGAYTAAGILYNKVEFIRFMSSVLDWEDTRPFILLIAPVEKLKEVSDLSDYIDF